MPTYVPRPILNIKHYRYQVRGPSSDSFLGDTASSIAASFGAGKEGYRELLAANLPRQTRALGRFSAETFAELEVGEALQIPFHWQDPPGIHSVLGDAYDAKQPKLDLTNPIFVAAKAATDKAGITDPAELGSVLNAVVQWYVNMRDTTAPIDTDLMDRLVTSASSWHHLIGSKLPADQVQIFPWAPFALLVGQSTLPYDAIDWGGAIPGTKAADGSGGLLWASRSDSTSPYDTDFPWTLVAKAGAKLETAPTIVKIEPHGDGHVTAGLLYQATKDALAATLQDTMCPDGQPKNADGSCPQPKGAIPQNAWCPLDLPHYDQTTAQCVDMNAPSKGGVDPSCKDSGPAGSLTWDSNTHTCTPALLDCAEGYAHKDNNPTLPCVRICKDPRMAWDAKDKACVCPKGEVINPDTGLCVMPPPEEKPKKSIIPVVLGVGLLGGLGYLLYRSSQAKKNKAKEEG
jgi:hypothetical protein